MEGNLEIVNQIRQALKENVDAKTLATGRRFFKEKIEFYGVRIPVVNKIGKDFFELVKGYPKDTILGLCEELWKSGYSEEGYIACNWSYFIAEYYTPEDITVFNRWIELYISNWATCDTLCNHSVGTFIEMYPEYIQTLKEWTHSTNRWKRRAAAVTLIIPARKGLFLKDIFEIADILLLDGDDLVQKGYGWMLKAASESHQKEVFKYVMSKKTVMPRTAFRYAIEKMPAELRAEAMKK